MNKIEAAARELFGPPPKPHRNHEDLAYSDRDLHERNEEAFAAGAKWAIEECAKVAVQQAAEHGARWRNEAESDAKLAYVNCEWAATHIADAIRALANRPNGMRGRYDK